MIGLTNKMNINLYPGPLEFNVFSSFRDLTNGYLVAEIFSWYFPQEIQMHMYNNGTSLESKLKNWSLLQIVSLL